ncbi:uncharacterized protein LOC144363593 [Saccoglossus kowalevskii]
MTAAENTSRKSILLVNDEWGTEKGGISTIHRQAAMLLSDTRNCDVYALTLTATDKDIDDAREHGINLIKAQVHARLINKDPCVDWFINDKSFFPGLDKITNVQAIIGHLPITGDAVIHLKKNRFQSAKLVLFNHVIPEDIEVYKESWSPDRVQDREETLLKAADEADAIFSVGPRMFNHFDNKYRAFNKDKDNHHEFLPKPDTKFFDVEIKRPKKDGKIQVITFGRILGVERLKGYDLVTQAMSGVVKYFGDRNQQVPVWIIRGVPKDEHDKAKKFLDEYKEDDRLSINPYPYGTQDKIRTDLKQSHLCIMASRSEPFGLVGMEAIAVGLPVLVTKNSGLAEYLQKEFPDIAESMIVGAGTKEEWTKAIKEVLQQPEYDSAFENAQKLKTRLQACQSTATSIELFKEAVLN